MPKALELTTLILDKKDESIVEVLNKTSLHLRREESSCTKPFVVRIPKGKYQSQVNLLTQIIKMALSYGDKKLTIDKYHIIVQKEFEVSAPLVKGLIGNSQIKVFIAHNARQGTLPQSR